MWHLHKDRIIYECLYHLHVSDENAVLNYGRKQLYSEEETVDHRHWSLTEISFHMGSECGEECDKR